MVAKKVWRIEVEEEENGVAVEDAGVASEVVVEEEAVWRMEEEVEGNGAATWEEEGGVMEEENAI